MISNWLAKVPMKTWRWILLAFLAFMTLAGVAIAVRFRLNILYGIPLAVVVLLAIINNFKDVWFLMVFCIPWSVQYEIGTGNAMDFFSEPFMLLFLLVFFVQLLSGRQFSLKGKIYTFHFLIFLLLFWTFFTTVTSHYFFRSFKFFLSKLWYLAAFVYIADRVIQRPKDMKRLFWAFALPLTAVVIIITLKHAAESFSFETAHNIPYPIFANGVAYSATLALFIPWLFLARRWYTVKSLEWYFLTAAVVLVAFGILFAYKRGGWLITLSLPVIYILIQRKVFDKLVYGGVGVVIIAVAFLLYNNNYYYLAPDYKKTIWHEGDLEGHLNATLQGTEISAAERFYRWVAAKNMIQDMPLVGSGPSTFNQVYQNYADGAFATYVSDNPEQSTTHNYFLMTFAEQGFPGGLLFAGNLQ
ncbi:MAG: O-antigen ligase family protein, partial [Bacteroidota bacterium]